jgi:hypothetical protein
MAKLQLRDSAGLTPNFPRYLWWLLPTRTGYLRGNCSTVCCVREIIEEWRQLFSSVKRAVTYLYYLRQTATAPPIPAQPTKQELLGASICAIIFPLSLPLILQAGEVPVGDYSRFQPSEVQILDPPLAGAGTGAPPLQGGGHFKAPLFKGGKGGSPDCTPPRCLPAIAF